MVKYIQKQFKTALNKLDYIDPWFWNRYTLNSYNGCQIGCIYCNARSKKYYLPIEFEKNIVVKTNLSKILEQQLNSSKSYLPDIVTISGTSDPYQNAEKQFFITQNSLVKLNEFNFPVHIITKSKLVLRDLSILASIANSTWASVSVTITTPKNNISKFLERGAPLPKDRFEIIKKIKEVNPEIKSGVLLIPLIPYLTDNESDIEEIINEAKKANADYILFSIGMTMEDKQALWFLNKLRNKYPDLITKYEALYDFNFDSSEYTGRKNPYDEYITRFQSVIHELSRKHKISIRIPRWIPNDFRRSNYIVAERLFAMSYYNQLDNLNWKSLFFAGHKIQNLNTSILNFYKSDRLQELELNENIIGIVENIINKENLQDVQETLDEWFS